MTDQKHEYAGAGSYAPYDAASGLRKASGMKKQIVPALVCGLVGVILLVWGGRLFPSCDKSGAGAAQDSSDAGDEFSEIEAYRAELERRITDICMQVAGAGDVSVIVVLDGGFRQVYAVEEKSSASGTSKTYVTVGSGSSQSPVLIMREGPAVAGIGIVCTGGQDPNVRREITSLLSAAFSIGSNKIYVTAMG